MNLRQKISVAVMDVCILAEVAVSMFFASKDPENLTLLFMKYFFSMLIPTLIMCRVAVKVLRSPESNENEAEPSISSQSI